MELQRDTSVWKWKLHEVNIARYGNGHLQEVPIENTTERYVVYAWAAEAVDEVGALQRVPTLSALSSFPWAS